MTARATKVVPTRLYRAGSTNQASGTRIANMMATIRSMVATAGQSTWLQSEPNQRPGSPPPRTRPKTAMARSAIPTIAPMICQSGRGLADPTGTSASAKTDLSPSRYSGWRFWK